MERKKINSFNVTGLLTFCLRTEMSLTETYRNLLLLFTFFVIRLFDNGEHFCIVVCYFFDAKWNRSRCWSRWENLNCDQYRFQPIKFVSSVDPSPCETEPYNRIPHRIRPNKLQAQVAYRPNPKRLTKTWKDHRQDLKVIKNKNEIS